MFFVALALLGLIVLAVRFPRFVGLVRWVVPVALLIDVVACLLPGAGSVA